MSEQDSRYVRRSNWSRSDIVTRDSEFYARALGLNKEQAIPSFIPKPPSHPQPNRGKENQDCRVSYKFVTMIKESNLEVQS